jgi:hypothetical protein
MPYLMGRCSFLRRVLFQLLERDADEVVELLKGIPQSVRRNTCTTAQHARRVCSVYDLRCHIFLQELHAAIATAHIICAATFTLVRSIQRLCPSC